MMDLVMTLTDLSIANPTIIYVSKLTRIVYLCS
jgi:hypothetical protein